MPLLLINTLLINIQEMFTGVQRMRVGLPVTLILYMVRLPMALKRYFLKVCLTILTFQDFGKCAISTKSIFFILRQLPYVH